MSFNEKHYSNTGDMIKHSKEIVISYLTRKGENQDIPINLHVVKKQEEAKVLLGELKILYEYKQRNMTEFV